MREKGMAATTVNDVMRGAGMTVGGFYAHFPSKDDLMAQTLSSAIRQSADVLVAAAGDTQGADWIRAVTGAYLSRAHRDNPVAGCPLPATASEMSAAPEIVREAFASQIEALVVELEAHEDESGAETPRQEAYAALAVMVGGMTLARALKGTPGSDAVLAACREHISRSMEV